MNNKTNGGHYIVDFFGCDPHQINNIDFWKRELPLAAAEAGMEILHSHFHEFDPEGITGFLLLSTSHMSIHTWPEYNYVACDIFSCSHGDETKKAVDYISKKIEHTRLEKHYIKRGYVMIDYLESPIYSTGKKEQIRISKKIFEIKSNFQSIVIVDTVNFGKCLVIDGIIQTSDSDHHIYDEALLSKITRDTKRILILGGGDGYVAETALELCPNAEISVVELDQEVINSSEKYLNQKVFRDSRINLVIGDAINYLKNQETNSEKYDLIISDLTDNPIGGNGNIKDAKKLYTDIVNSAFNLLKGDGWIAVQGGASKVCRKYVDVSKIVSQIMQKTFSNVEKKDVFIPSFGENGAFLFSNKK